MENSKAMLWTGRVMSGIVILFMIFDVTIKYLGLPIVEQTGIPLGLPAHSARGLAVMETIILLLYVWPRTAVLGAVLFTGLFGATMAIHWRVGDPLLSHILFGFYLALLVWGGLYLRDARLRALLPLTDS
jgi:DoxX-like protein